MRYRITALAAACALALSTAACGSDSGSSDDGPGSLVLASYGGNTAEMQQRLLFAPFTEETGIEVKVNTVPGQQVAGITAQNEAGDIKWDMTLGLADNDMATLQKAGYLATMPDDLLTSLRGSIPSAQPFGVPNKNGSVLIVCNKRLVDKCPQTAAELFDTKGFPGDRIFPSFQPLVLMALAMEANGVGHKDVFTDQTTEEQLTAATKAMDGLRPSIKTFYDSSTTAIQLFQQGEVGIAGLWNGAARKLAEDDTDNVDLGYTWDDAVTYTQWDVVFKGAPNEENAWRLIRWLHENPERLAAYLTEASGGAADPKVFAGLPPETQEWVAATDGPRAENTVVIDPLWLSSAEGREERINDYWKTYTAGG